MRTTALAVVGLVYMSFVLKSVCSGHEESYAECNPCSKNKDSNSREVPHLLYLGRIGMKVYYRSLGLRLTWVDSFNFCHSNGLQMATIESAAEQQALQSFMTPEKLNDLSDTAPRWFWIGGMWIRGNVTDVYWMNDGRKCAYTNWVEGQPDYPEIEHCIHLRQDKEWKWNNLKCMFQSPVICQKSVMATSISYSYLHRHL